MSTYIATAPNRADLDAMQGPVVLDFGTDWCTHCQRAQPVIATGLMGHPDVQHLKIEDGKGRPLGRTYQVKLWPTLIFLKDGVERSRLVRPQSAQEVATALADILA